MRQRRGPHTPRGRRLRTVALAIAVTAGVFGMHVLGTHGTGTHPEMSEVLVAGAEAVPMVLASDLVASAHPTYPGNPGTATPGDDQPLPSGGSLALCLAILGAVLSILLVRTGTRVARPTAARSRPVRSLRRITREREPPSRYGLSVMRC